VFGHLASIFALYISKMREESIKVIKLTSRPLYDKLQLNINVFQNNQHSSTLIPQLRILDVHAMSMIFTTELEQTESKSVLQSPTILPGPCIENHLDTMTEFYSLHINT
jgi:hypothetical protein